MMLNQLRYVRSNININTSNSHNKFFSLDRIYYQTATQREPDIFPKLQTSTVRKDEITQSEKQILSDIFPTQRVVPMVLADKEPVVLSFDDVPGPKALKYLSNIRQYFSDVGTQLTAGVLTVGLNIGTYFNSRKPLKSLSVLFDEYGPVVRFVSPVGSDIVLINHPEYIEKVYTMEGEYPIRSTLDSLDKYRMEHRSNGYGGGLYTLHGQEWFRRRDRLCSPLQNAGSLYAHGINDVCENFVRKVYNIRNHQDEVSKELYKEVHKWAFDCVGLVMFSKKFTMLDSELVYNQCDMSWLYHSLEKATEAIINLIGKHVMETEQSISFTGKEKENNFCQNSLVNAMLLGDDRMTPEDIATIIMDMLLIGVNTITSSMTFMLYHLAKYQLAQKNLYEEVRHLNLDLNNISNIKENTPYLQACIRENLRLVPPIPVISRILPKNITLDRYNIPRGTLIIMSTQDASLKESNYDDATKFKPERWLLADSKDYHAFASVPFGHGARKCLGQNIAETMLTLLVIKLVQKYKMEYHYGDIHPTRTFIAKPNKPLKVRFIDRI